MFPSSVSVGLLLSHAVATVQAQTSGSFTVLTYNVAGLPEILSSGNPEVNTPLISSRLKPFNVINVQEDFNYHATLYASDNHAFRTPTSGGVPFGDGLNTLSDFSYIDLERVKWDKCNSNDGDCLTPKGFSFARVRVADSVWVDVYNLHTDAGSDDGDRTARASNLAQVSAYIQSHSQGMPVVVMGDTNSRYTSDVDSDSLHSLIDVGGFTDSWVKNIRGGSFPTKGSTALTCPFPFPSGTSQATMNACEVVDKIFVRGSEVVQLVPASYRTANNDFVNSTGAPLSDHYPQSTVAQWTLSNSLRLGDTAGGPHGDMFNDIPALLAGKSVPKVSSITVRAADRVDGISVSVTYPDGNTASATHGGTGGTAQTLTLASGERITQVQTCTGQKDANTRVFYLNFVTNQGRSFSGGKQTADCQTASAPSGTGAGGKAWGLVAFWGRQGDEMDRLGAIWGAGY
ncbi:hypothetical protein V5O48_007692 [Marasmius crinis-equi]|uniref:Jacalin-type lectin domain-containing protein n=1 Tax=Marasmius crinis-equi TaxID=585013 RepID=A0ABR3FGF5_9AGAR